MSTIEVLVCGTCNGLLKQHPCMDAYVCDEGHVVYGIDLFHPERCAIYEGEGLQQTIRFLR
jgi:hypothetical protein